MLENPFNFAEVKRLWEANDKVSLLIHPKKFVALFML